MSDGNSSLASVSSLSYPQASNMFSGGTQATQLLVLAGLQIHGWCPRCIAK